MKPKIQLRHLFADLTIPHLGSYVFFVRLPPLRGQPMVLYNPWRQTTQDLAEFDVGSGDAGLNP
jgi:hypothetical protein